MEYLNLGMEEASDMDFILNKVSELVDSKDGTWDINWLHLKFLKTKGEYYAVDLVFKILAHEPKILYAEKRQGIKTVVWTTPLLSDFLAKGGFTKIANEIDIRKKSEEKKEKLNFEKLQYDVRNSKRIFKTYWLTFGMALVAFIISLILFYLKLREMGTF